MDGGAATAGGKRGRAAAPRLVENRTLARSITGALAVHPELTQMSSVRTACASHACLC